MITKQVILLVEDNDDDAELTTMALKEARIGNRVVRARDSVEALDYLFARNAYQGRDLGDQPAVVLLDLKMPRLGGLETLEAIRGDERSKRLPVVILTSSTEEQDRITAYDRYANSYVQKPVDYDQFVEAARHLGLYWLVLNVLRGKTPPGAPCRVRAPPVRVDLRDCQDPCRLLAGAQCRMEDAAQRACTWNESSSRT